METFTCEKYRCMITRQACADRQAARTLIASRKHPTYPGCQDCTQGAKETTGIVSAVKPRAWGRTLHNQNTGGNKMARKKRIDDGILKKLIEEGKFADEIAKEFGCAPGAIRTRIKILGLAPNYRRSPKHNNPDRERQPGMDLTYVPGQIIPVTLRLTVEVNVRVSTESV
ncbi:MAG: hypothetical protein PHN98_01085 [Smithellaceae bacterium]|jgi:hypothetical protein|nr:hypothetical protein [Smithellaceae bacterium]